MRIHCELVILILALAPDGPVHAVKIIGGHEAVPHRRPYMVLLKLHGQNGTTSHCGGFLLNKDFVMTAAHCKAVSYTVSLGVHNVRNKNEIQTLSVEKAFPHNDFIMGELKNDIMLLKLSSKANFSQNVKPIELAGQGDGALPKSCIVSGWGRTNKTRKFLSLALMEVNVTLTDKKWYPEEKSYFSEGETGPAEGDSGGPLVCEDGKAYGVVSAKTQPKCDGLQICHYTKIPDYRDWIDSIMEHH